MKIKIKLDKCHHIVYNMVKRLERSHFENKQNYSEEYNYV